VPEHEFLDEEQADADDSVDNAEAEEQPYDSAELPDEHAAEVDED
jgi:hypothetical protein